MAEATAAIQEVRRTGHETPEGSFQHLGVLSWLSSNTEQIKNKPWLRNPLSWFQARQVLTGLDWRKALPTALWQRHDFDKSHSDEKPITKTEKDDSIIAFNTAFYELFNAPDRKVHSQRVSLLANTFVNFGDPKLGIKDKLFRLYISPKISLDSYKRALSIIRGIFENEGLVGQVKGNTEGFYREVSEDQFVPSSDTNRVVVYLNAEDGDGITKLLRGLADSNIFDDLEDSGQWALEAKIPIAKGLSSVEGTGESWDTKDSKELEVIKEIIRESYSQVNFYRVVERIMKLSKGANLGNAERVSQMPGLLATSPLIT